MKSKIIAEDRQALSKLSKSMTPEERLMAFLRHSRLMAKLREAGKSFRKSKTSRT